MAATVSAGMPMPTSLDVVDCAPQELDLRTWGSIIRSISVERGWMTLSQDGCVVSLEFLKSLHGYGPVATFVS